MKKIILSAIIAGCVTMVANASSGTHNGYYWQNYYVGGSSTMTLGSGGNYAVSYSGVSDVVAGEGWNPGGSRTVGYNCGALTGSYNNFSVYGWTTSPLIEYYICEKGSVASGSSYGTVSSDGHTYNIYKHQQVNQPSIQGTATFWQYLSNWGGSSTGANHSVTTGNHFAAWKSKLGSMGTFNYMIVEVEAYGGKSGYCNCTVW